MSDCLFCKIAEGQIPSNKVYEDEVCYAFYDIDPQAPTHFLVIPKMHIASVAEVTEDNAAVAAHIFAVISKVTKELGLESYRVVSNIGEQALLSREARSCPGRTARGRAGAVHSAPPARRCWTPRGSSPAPAPW